MRDRSGPWWSGRSTELGRLDTLVNNAGVMLLGPIVDAPTEEWRRMVHLNVLGLLYCTHAALPHLLQAAEDEPRHVADVDQRELRGGADRPPQQRRVQRHQVRGERVQRVIAPGGDQTPRSSHAGGTWRDRLPSSPVTTGPRCSRAWQRTFGDTELLTAEDIAEAVVYTVTRPRRVAVNEVLIRPTEQER